MKSKSYVYFTGILFLTCASSSYSASVCTKNLSAVESAIQKRNAPFYWAYGEFTEKVIREFSKVLQPCAASDADARRKLNEMQEQLADNQKNCSINAQLCRDYGEWGAGGVTDTGEPTERANRRAFSILQEEVQRVLTTSSNTSQPSTSDPHPQIDADCTAKLRVAAQEINAAAAKMSSGGATQAMGAVMCSAQKEASVIRNNCTDNAANRYRIGELKKTYEQAEKACQQLSTGNYCSVSSVCASSVFVGIQEALGRSNNQAQQQTTLGNQTQQQAQQAAHQNQARADQQRQGKRKTNDPAAQAHECVAINQAGSGNYGAFKNTCSYKVNFTTCNYKPRTIQGGFNWSADFDCEKNQFGLHTPDAGRAVAAHNRNTEMVYWFACKAPATPVDAAFVVGKGIEARCY